MTTNNEWIKHYDSLKQDVMKMRREGKHFPSSTVEGVKENIRNLESKLSIMESSQLEYEIFASEIARRKHLISTLRRQVDGIPTLNNALPSSSNSSGMSTSDGVRNPLTTDKALVSRQEQIIKMQDEAVLDIGKGVDRIHQQALVINKEAKLHNQILDKLDTHVDDTTERLRQEAMHAEEVRVQSQVCCLYIVIAVEIILALVLAIVAFGAKK